MCAKSTVALGVLGFSTERRLVPERRRLLSVAPDVFCISAGSSMQLHLPVPLVFQCRLDLLSLWDCCRGVTCYGNRIFLVSTLEVGVCVL